MTQEHHQPNRHSLRNADKKRRRNSPVADSVPRPAEETVSPSVDTLSALPASGQAALLHSAASDEARADLASHLQRSHGNAYLQRLLESKTVQAKLPVSPTGDAYEQEADRAAREVAAFSGGSAGAEISRQPEEEEELLQAKREDGLPEVTADMESRINAQRGGGQPVAGAVQASFEPHLGADFSQVRVHTDAEADSLNRELDAEAFTTGADIFFRSGNYQPDTEQGRGILAHELTHVVQQGGASPAGSTGVQRLQLLRSGRTGRARYEETSADVITIRMPYQIDSLEQILENVDDVVRVFGSSSRTYTSDTRFQSDLRTFLRSIHHRSLIGEMPGMSRELRRTLSFAVRLVREGQRIETIEFATAVPEAATETPLTAEEQMLEELAEREAQPPAAAPQPARAEPGAGQASIYDLLTEHSFSEQAAADIDSLGDLISARWLWDPITAQMREYDEELDAIGENFRTQPVVGQLMIPTITHLSVLLDAIVGTLDFCARIPAMPARVASVALEYHAGAMSSDELWDILEECGMEALNLLSGGLITAADHLAEGVRELNPVQFIRGVDELVLAVISLIGMFRGLRSLRARIRARGAGRGAPLETPAAEAPTIEAPVEAETATGRAPAPVEVEAPTVEPPAQAEAPTGRGSAPVEVEAPTGRAEAIGQPESPRATPSAEASAFGATERPPSAGPAPRGNLEGNAAIEYTIREAADVSQMREQIVRGERPGLLRHSEASAMQAEWDAAGGNGTAPAGWMQSDGVLRVNLDAAGPIPAELAREYVLGAQLEAEARGAAAESAGRAQTRGLFEEAERLRASGESPRPRSAGAPPAGEINGLRIEYTVEDVAEARVLRDQIMTGGREGRVSFASAEFLQGEWEAFGGEGPAPPAWWQNDGLLRTSFEGAGWPSVEVQFVSARAYRPARPMPAPVQQGVEVLLTDPETVQQMMRDTSQIRLGIERKPGPAAYRDAWQARGESGAPPSELLAFIDHQGVMVVNGRALAQALRALRSVE